MAMHRHRRHGTIIALAMSICNAFYTILSPVWRQALSSSMILETHAFYRSCPFRRISPLPSLWADETCMRQNSTFRPFFSLQVMWWLSMDCNLQNIYQARSGVVRTLGSYLFLH
ncbi:hypothetical protein V1509DRAFT_626332 [Lipomyces kononenkoae]